MSSSKYRRIDAADIEFVDSLVASGTIPAPECSFTNSLFREMKFVSNQDAELFDLYCYISGLK
jgi:hypothetical protein